MGRWMNPEKRSRVNIFMRNFCIYHIYTEGSKVGDTEIKLSVFDSQTHTHTHIHTSIFRAELYALLFAAQMRKISLSFWT